MGNDRYKNSDFLRQAAILIGAGFFVRIIGFLYRLPMQNMLGDEGTGIYAQGYNIYIFFFVLSSAGLPAAISKMVSSRIALRQYNNAKKVFEISIVFAIIVGSICASILFFKAKMLANFINSPDAESAIKTLAPTAFIVAIMSVYRGYFQGMGNSVPTALSQVIEQIFNAGFSIYLVYVFISDSIIKASAGGTAGSGIGAFMGLIVLLGIYFLMKPRIKKNMNKTKRYEKIETGKKIAMELIITSIPIIAGTAIFSMTNLIDTKMTTSILINSGFSYEDAKKFFGQLNGKYVVITTLPVSIATAMATAAIPSVASSVALRDKKEINRKINLALRLTMIISIPAAFGLAILGEQILKFLFPSNVDGYILLKIGAPSIIFLALSQIGTGMLQGIGKLIIPAVSALCGVIVKIPLNYFLISIKSVNIVGAVISTTVCYIISSYINIRVTYKTTGTKIDFKEVFLKPLISSIVMSCICYIFYYTTYYIYPNNTSSLCISIILGILSYFVFMIIIKGITENDLIMIPMGDKIVKKFKDIGLL